MKLKIKMKNTTTLFSFLVFLSSQLVFSQEIRTIASLPNAIEESSGLVFYNDSILITHNDSGDKPILYFINLKGKLVDHHNDKNVVIELEQMGFSMRMHVDPQFIKIINKSKPEDKPAKKVERLLDKLG